MLKVIMLILFYSIANTNPYTDKSERETTMDKKIGDCESSRNIDDRTRIVGGENVKISQYPFMAQIVSFRKNGRAIFCGGSIINPQHVLTAGHCITLPSGRVASVRSLRIRVGASNLSCGGQSVAAARIYRHPFYKPLSCRLNGAAFYDMAVIKLVRPVKYCDTVAAIVIASASDTPVLQEMASQNRYCKVLGWGWTKPNLKSDEPPYRNSLSTVLKATDVKLINWGQCRSLVPILDVKAELCCSSPRPTSGCKGDSGGPLVCEDSKQYGLVARGTGAGCGIPNQPYIYTRVDTLSKFIDSVLRKSERRSRRDDGPMGVSPIEPGPL